MTIGTQSDILSRIKAVLPTGWFQTAISTGTSQTPVLDGVLAGPAYMMAWLYSMLQFVIMQSRRLTATGAFIDMIAADFFCKFIKRRVNETDANFNIRIGKELFREKVTRHGMIQALTDLTGRAPTIFEPQYPKDTGCWGGPTLGYGVAGAYGSLLLPFQYFITAYRPTGLGVATVAGWGNISTFEVGAGGYGVGAIEYANPSMFAPPVTDTDIQNVVNDVRPSATIAWMRISS
jgi:hypothetical protein